MKTILNVFKRNKMGSFLSTFVPFLATVFQMGEGGVEREVQGADGSFIKRKGENECGTFLDPPGMGAHCASTGRMEYMRSMSILLIFNCFVIGLYVWVRFGKRQLSDDKVTAEQTLPGDATLSIIIALLLIISIGYRYHFTTYSSDRYNYGTTDFLWGTRTDTGQSVQSIFGFTHKDVNRGPLYKAFHAGEMGSTGMAQQYDEAVVNMFKEFAKENTPDLVTQQGDQLKELQQQMKKMAEKMSEKIDNHAEKNSAENDNDNVVLKVARENVGHVKEKVQQEFTELREDRQFGRKVYKNRRTSHGARLKHNYRRFGDAVPIAEVANGNGTVVEGEQLAVWNSPKVLKQIKKEKRKQQRQEIFDEAQWSQKEIDAYKAAVKINPKLHKYKDLLEQYSPHGRCDVCALVTGERHFQEKLDEHGEPIVEIGKDGVKYPVFEVVRTEGMCSTRTECILGAVIYAIYSAFFLIMSFYILHESIQIHNKPEADRTVPESAEMYGGFIACAISFLIGLLCLSAVPILSWSAKYCPGGSQFLANPMSLLLQSIRW